jgi:hypothetical protein
MVAGFLIRSQVRQYCSAFLGMEKGFASVFYLYRSKLLCVTRSLLGVVVTIDPVDHDDGRLLYVHSPLLPRNQRRSTRLTSRSGSRMHREGESSCTEVAAALASVHGRQYPR